MTEKFSVLSLETIRNEMNILTTSAPAAAGVDAPLRKSLRKSNLSLFKLLYAKNYIDILNYL